MTRRLHAIRRWLDKFQGGNGQATYGKWYVLYEDGQKSQRMHHSTAKGYASIFHGTVRHVDDPPEVAISPAAKQTA